MVKIIYNGDLTPMRIKILSSIINNWKKGEVKELNEECANALINDNRNFSYVDGKYKQPEEKKVEKPTNEKKEKVKFDLDGDGDFDEDDVSIAGRAMGAWKKVKKK